MSDRGDGGDDAPASDRTEAASTDLDVPEGLTVALVAAVAENRIIGAEGEMPWHYPADLQHFKETTTGHPVIMGRRTYESIVDNLGEPLPERTTVVLSRSDLDLPDGAVLANDPQVAVDEAASAAAELDVGTVYVAGGGTVYELFLPVADRLVLTEIHETVAGDTRFPAVDDETWTETARTDREALSFVTYDRA